jgi:large subunit ribosomal protein L21
MFAVIKTGGKQYKVAAADLIEVEKLAGSAGDQVDFGEVLMLGGDAGTTLGSPTVAGASVTGEIVDHQRGAKVLIFKKRRRQNYKRTKGHRQDYTLVRITSIVADGKPLAAAEAKPARKPRAKAAAAGAAAE